VWRPDLRHRIASGLLIGEEIWLPCFPSATPTPTKGATNLCLDEDTFMELSHNLITVTLRSTYATTIF
jgi:hypothetical protein